MRTEHTLLSAIRAGVDTSGRHTHHWGELRRQVFGGTESWVALKAWCASNAFECELTFSQSSKVAEVQFRRVRRS